MTRQEIVTKSWERILAQGGPASMKGDGVSCCYRNGDGLKCAIGVLLTDGTIDAIREAGMNCTSIDKLLSFKVSEELQDLQALMQEAELCTELQRAHDTAAFRCSLSPAGFLAEFASNVRRICGRYDLDEPTKGYRL
jgi:hypothetical protein